jgi:HD-GYP domain-containing protein (c-di-GMP phosphodiesterase class II)
MLSTLALKSPGRPFPLAARAKALSVILSQEFGVPFTFYDAAQGQEVALPEGVAPRSPCPKLPPEKITELASRGKCCATCLGDDYELHLVLSDSRHPTLIAQGVMPGLVSRGPDWMLEQDRLQKWLQAVSDRIRLSEQLAAYRTVEEEQAAQAARAWSVVLGVDDSIRRVRVHRDGDRVLHGLLKSAYALMGVRTLVWVPEEGTGQVVVQGEPLLPPPDCRHLTELLARHSPEVRAGKPVFWNEDQSGLWAACCPGVVNLLAVPVADSPPLGWVVAFNKTEGAAGPLADRARSAGPGPFRRADAAVLMPFASLIGLQLRGARRFLELKDLLVGLTRSLTAAIDAKDSYTFGHSERVARIGVEVGKHLNLSEDDLSDVYLAGLLHDIGKIGIRDSVLLKSGPLTEEEFDHIKQHVVIGHRILADLRPLRNLLPGVRNHHERFDGKGYPDGLAGENIPLLARLLAVADSYDAMSTKRPYRDGLSHAEIEERLRQGVGTQWDPRVIEAFFQCRQQVHLIRQRGVGESLNQALDGALRSQKSVVTDTRI